MCSEKVFSQLISVHGGFINSLHCVTISHWSSCNDFNVFKAKKHNKHAVTDPAACCGHRDNVDCEPSHRPLAVYVNVSVDLLRRRRRLNTKPTSDSLSVKSAAALHKTHHCETTEALRVFNAALAQVWPYSIWTMWLRPTAGYWTHRHFMSTNATQWWSDETPWGWWWHSQLAEYYGGNSTRHMKQCSVSK